MGWMAAAFVVVVVLFAYFGDELDAPPPDERTESPSARRESPSPAARPAASDPGLPPFHENAEAARPFPQLQDPSRYETPVVARAYAIAREIPEVLAQQPCYCNCGVFGHASLLDCYASDHGAT
jgi:hypothetical protein